MLSVGISHTDLGTGVKAGSDYRVLSPPGRLLPSCKVSLALCKASVNPSLTHLLYSPRSLIIPPTQSLGAAHSTLPSQQTQDHEAGCPGETR